MKRYLIFFLGMLAFFITLSVGYGSWQTKQAMNQVLAGDIQQATQHAHNARWVPEALVLLTLGQQPDVLVWKESLDILTLIENVFLQQDATKIPDLLSKQQSFTENYQRSWIIQQTVDKQLATNNHDDENTLSTGQILGDLLPITQSLLEGKHTYIITFQNTNEIRATGGFMGSYAKISLNNGIVSHFGIYDIYEPDGQYDGYIEAPTGVLEYLSSGNGLRLPDANWHPDFPTSAQTSLSYFAFGNDKAINGLIALNLDVVEKILEILGPLYLPDYEITVTAENLSSVARVDRDTFFPGSQQKKHFLSTLQKQIIFELEKSSEEQKKEILGILIENLEQKNIQLYSNDQSLQGIFEKYAVAGELSTKNPSNSLFLDTTAANNLGNTDNYLYLIESNVGINKANKHIDRSLKISQNPKTTTLTLFFNNNNQPPQRSFLSPEEIEQDARNNQGADEADHLGYVNYQRIILHQETKVESITINGKALNDWNEEIITNSKGDSFLQVGFLVVVPELEQTVVSVVTQTVNQGSNAFILQKQSGIPAYEVTLSINGSQKKHLLDRDTRLSVD